MTELPRDVHEAIARGIAAYVRATEAAELPGPIRKFKGFTDRGIKSRAQALVAALSDAGLRARVIEWLDDRPRRLPRRDEELLRIAAERVDGWKERLADAGLASSKARARPRGVASDVELERERDKVRKARQQARSARDEASRVADTERARAAKLADEVAELRDRLITAEREAAAARKEVAAERERFDRELRKARRDSERAIADRDRHKEIERAARKEIAALRRDTQKAAPKPARAPRTSSTQASAAARPATPPPRRKRLPAPLGRLDDDPETLAEWLDAEAVRLVIDGYNVTKAEGGFSELSLEGQRERLTDAVTRLARRKGIVETIIVFDGSEVPPGAGRRGRGKVRVEYSAPDVIADDHIVALVRSLPTHPVVVVTNDRELQNRVARLAATVARSDQLLGLLR